MLAETFHQPCRVSCDVQMSPQRSIAHDATPVVTIFFARKLVVPHRPDGGNVIVFQVSIPRFVVDVLKRCHNCCPANPKLDIVRKVPAPAALPNGPKVGSTPSTVAPPKSTLLTGVLSFTNC